MRCSLNVSFHYDVVPVWASIGVCMRVVDSYVSVESLAISQLIERDHITSDVFLCLYRIHGVSYYPTISVELPSDSNTFRNL